MSSTREARRNYLERCIYYRDNPPVDDFGANSWYLALMATHRSGEYHGLDQFIDYLATTGRTLADFEAQHGHKYEHNGPVYGEPLRPTRESFLRHAASRRSTSAAHSCS
jgi:hypothetical protein